ncbi:hypothetical protein CW304_28060 [Bacillus sp. UFRGS-B20]|nr:hypothetical protein CW304_28060 [Bacillus sp. UFRGS-B20]
MSFSFENRISNQLLYSKLESFFASTIRSFSCSLLVYLLSLHIFYFFRCRHLVFVKKVSSIS